MKRLSIAATLLTLLLASCNQNASTPPSTLTGHEGGAYDHVAAEPTFTLDLRQTPFADLTGEQRARLGTEAAVQVVLSDGTLLIYANQGGVMVMDGDMLLGSSAQAAKYVREVNDARPASIGGQSLSRFAAGQANWSGNTVPYFWNANAFSSTQIAALNAAITRWNEQAGQTVRWVWNPNAANKVQFVPGGSGSCGSSYVGSIGGTQPVTITCFNNGTIIHEMGHASGFHHEHQRCDRDNYITVGSQYVGDSTNFGRYCNAYTHGPYDYDSVMNYGAPYTYPRSQPVGSYNGTPGNLGRTSQLSGGDLFALRAIYPGGTTPTPDPDPTPDPTPTPEGKTYTGTLSAGYYTLQPGSAGFSYWGGTLTGSLSAPAGSDFDLYLQQKYSDGNWYTVAKSTSPGDTENVRLNTATGGIYRWYIYSYSGSGSYTLVERK